MRKLESPKLEIGIGTLAAILCTTLTAAAADLGSDIIGKKEGDFVVRLRGASFLTDTSGTTDTLGGSARTNDNWIPELDFTYFFTKNIAAELVLTSTKHTVEVKNSTSGDLDLGTVRLLPPVLTLQYHFLPDSVLSPYAGAGLNYTIPFDTDKGRSVNSVSYSREIGYAFQVGADYFLDKNWLLNFDVKKVLVETDIKVNGGAINAKDTDLDPWIISVGIGYRF